MGKNKSCKSITSAKTGWKVNSKDGKFLCKLLENKKLSPGITPAALKEIYPQFKKYKNESFASALHHLKTKYGSNVCGDTGR
jgi:hypothetical protein